MPDGPYPDDWAGRTGNESAPRAMLRCYHRSSVRNWIYNNPPDDSNWELLCVYCHDNEHARYVDHVRGVGHEPAPTPRATPPINPLPGWRPC